MLSNENSVSIIRALKYELDREKKHAQVAASDLKRTEIALAELREIHNGQKFGDADIPSNVNDWTVAHVAKYLIKNGWGDRIKQFENKNINGRLLMSGYVDKSDLKELGFSGIDAAKFLTWILDCRKESGDHMFVGRTLTHNDLILALKYAFQLGDSNDDCLLSKKECLLASLRHQEVSDIFSACHNLRGLCIPRQYSETFDRIDKDQSGFISMSEILTETNLVRDVAAGFPQAIKDILKSVLAILIVKVEPIQIGGWNALFIVCPSPL